MTHDLTDGIELKAGALDAFGPLGLDIGAKTTKDCLIKGGEVVARNCLARGNGDVPSGIDGEYAAAHRTVMPRFIPALPANDGDHQACEEIRVPRQYPKAAGGIFRPQRKDSVFIYDHR
jgi:hypothetical protein